MSGTAGLKREASVRDLRKNFLDGLSTSGWRQKRERWTGSGHDVGVELIWQAGPQRDMGCLPSSLLGGCSSCPASAWP